MSHSVEYWDNRIIWNKKGTERRYLRLFGDHPRTDWAKSRKLSVLWSRSVNHRTVMFICDDHIYRVSTACVLLSIIVHLRPVVFNTLQGRLLSWYSPDRPALEVKPEALPLETVCVTFRPVRRILELMLLFRLTQHPPSHKNECSEAPLHTRLSKSSHAQ
jgi:hypothetical protein